MTEDQVKAITVETIDSNIKEYFDKYMEKHKPYKEITNLIMDSCKNYARALFDSYEQTMDKKYEQYKKYRDREYYLNVTKILCITSVVLVSTIVLGTIAVQHIKGVG